MRFLTANRNDVKTLIADKTCALISITTSNGIHPDVMPGWGAIYRIRFDDIDKPTLDFKLFNDEIAHGILDFVLGLQQTTVVVNCDAGVSRSTGVVLALERIFNKTNVGSTYQIHNRYVATKLLKVAMVKGLI
jgi:predicted protein tyrosine phosphatase